MRFIDLFAGVGGFRLGMERAGYECVWSGEWDKFARVTYEKNFGTAPGAGDIREVDENAVPDHEVICGGFPFQGFSSAGKRESFADIRGTLFFELMRIARATKTTYLFLDNVKGLLSHDKGRTFETILKTLNELGYDAQWQVLNSKFFGVPQNRERVFIIAHLRGWSRPEIFPLTKSNENIDESDEEEAGVHTPAITNQGGRNCRGMFIQQEAQINVVGVLCSAKWLKRNESSRRVYGSDGVAPTIPTGAGGGQIPKIAIPVLTPDRPKKLQNGRRFKEDGDPSFTLTAQDRHGVFDGYSIRRLTPLEYERLQSFPDGWTEGEKRFISVKLFGNIWEFAKSKDVGENSSQDRNRYVSSITRDGESGEIQTLHTQTRERIKEDVQSEAVIELLTAENSVCDIINLGEDMVMLYNQKGTLKQEEITKQNLISERMEEKSTYPLWKITFREDLPKERLSTILTLNCKRFILNRWTSC